MEPISESAVHKSLSRLGCDSNLDILDLDSKLLKIAAPLIETFLTSVFNYSLQNGIVFNDWKYSRVTPIYKGTGSKELCSNYRPISVVCHIAKIIEKIIQSNLHEYLIAHDLITIDQSAFLKAHSILASIA